MKSLFSSQVICVYMRKQKCGFSYDEQSPNHLGCLRIRIEKEPESLMMVLGYYANPENFSPSGAYII